MALPETVESVTLTVRKAAIACLQQLLGDRLSTTATIREQHGKDASYHSCVPPDAVAFGTDVLKALACGARAVFIGRPVLWGLACGGEIGVRYVLEMVRQEFDLAMALCGCPTLSSIT